jgi:hypothetical protein
MQILSSNTLTYSNPISSNEQLTLKLLVFWKMMLRHWASSSWCFQGSYCFYFQWLLAVKMNTIQSFETPGIQQTQHYILGDFNVWQRHYENLKSYNISRLKSFSVSSFHREKIKSPWHQHSPTELFVTIIPNYLAHCHIFKELLQCLWCSTNSGSWDSLFHILLLLTTIKGLKHTAVGGPVQCCGAPQYLYTSHNHNGSKKVIMNHAKRWRMHYVHNLMPGSTLHLSLLTWFPHHYIRLIYLAKPNLFLAEIYLHECTQLATCGKSALHSKLTFQKVQLWIMILHVELSS